MKIESKVLIYSMINNLIISIAKITVGLILDLDNKLTLRQVSNLEKKIKKSITRHTSFDIKYVTIYVTNKID